MLFRSVAAAFLFVCLSIPAFAQQPSTSDRSTAPNDASQLTPRWGMTSDQMMDRAVDTLQRTLSLSPSQATTVRRLAQERRETFQSIREQARPKFRELMTLLREQNPDPAAVGRIVIDLKSTVQQARQQQMEFERRFTALLNPDQQRIVNNLREQAQTFAALHSLGLLGAPELPHGGFMGSMGPDSGPGSVRGE